MSKLPIDLTNLLRQRTVEAKGETEQALVSLAAKVPSSARRQPG